jgi:hypothetical protein
MTHPAIEKLAKQYKLTASDKRFLDATQARSVQTAYSLLAACLPPTESEGLEFRGARALMAKLNPAITKEHKTAIKPWLRNGTAGPPPRLARSATRPTPPAPPRLEGPDVIDLVGEARYPHWSAEDQGERNTCVGFAVASLVELRLLKKTSTDFLRLSPQFLYWHMRRQAPERRPPGWDVGATKLGQAKDVLTKYGICTWDDCPYPSHVEGTDGPEPNDAAKVGALKRKVTCTVYEDDPDLTRRDEHFARMVHKRLKAGRPVAVALPVYRLAAGGSATNWNLPEVQQHGRVQDPPQGWKPPSDAPGHAVCVVGFQRDTDESNGGWFIFRNSAGLLWGASPGSSDRKPYIPDPGFGAISASYIENYCWELLS